MEGLPKTIASWKIQGRFQNISLADQSHARFLDTEKFEGHWGSMRKILKPVKAQVSE